MPIVYILHSINSQRDQIFKPIVFDIYSARGNRNDVLVAAQKNEKPVSHNDSRNENEQDVVYI